MKVTSDKRQNGTITYADNGQVKIGVTTQRGMRISHISFDGGENLCFCDQKEEEFSPLPNGQKWFSHGGHRLWKSPEDFFCYYDDNNPCFLQVDKNGFTLTSPCTRQGLDMKIVLSFCQKKKNRLHLTHSICNRFDQPQKIAAWAISALKCPAVVDIFVDEKTEGLLPNRNVVLWPYTNGDDRRINYQQGKLTICGKQDMPPLKIGTFSPCGKMTYTRGDTVLVVENKKINDFSSYPDFGCNTECYTNKNVVEVEMLSPYKTLKKNQSVTLAQTWSFEKLTKE